MTKSRASRDSMIVSRRVGGSNAFYSLEFGVFALLFVRTLTMMLSLLLIMPASAEDHSGDDSAAHSNHVGHSDALMVLLGHKIALQKLQGQLKAQLSIQQSDKNPVQGLDQSPGQNLARQGKIFQQVMPILSSYMSTPKSYYLTTQMYHDSLENRAAMLADFTALLVEYQKQLVSLP